MYFWLSKFLIFKKNENIPFLQKTLNRESSITVAYYRQIFILYVIMFIICRANIGKVLLHKVVIKTKLTYYLVN